MFATKPYCHKCEHLIAATKYGDVVISKTVNGKRKRFKIKSDEMYCNKGELFKINRNHVRWWGFSRQCPLNPYQHTCLGCGQRMCTTKTVCSGCRKNNDRFNGKI